MKPSYIPQVPFHENLIKLVNLSIWLLLVGARIDHAHHHGYTHKALNDTVAFSDAVQKALDLVNLDDTLIVVSADHSHAFTFSGYQGIDSNVLGMYAFTFSG